MANVVLLVQLVTTFAMVGLIWFVQVVHYPLMAQVGSAGFADYERSHQQRTTSVVAPLMLLEAASSLLLLWWRPSGISLAACSVGVVLLAVVWASTYLLQVPLHRRLQDAYSAEHIRRLVVTNWLRTAAWTGRGFVVAWMVAAQFQTA